MFTYLLLLTAIAFEITATTCLKISYGFTKLIPSIIVVIGYTASFWLLSITLKTLPVGVVYAIWSGLGIVGIAMIGVYFFEESFTFWHFVGMSLILTGIIILNLITPAEI